jgi:hypothetical protein
MSLSHRTLEDWRLTGRGPRFQKLGSCVRYRISELEYFVADRCFENTGQAVAS